MSGKGLKMTPWVSIFGNGVILYFLEWQSGIFFRFRCGILGQKMTRNVIFKKFAQLFLYGLREKACLETVLK